MHNRKCPGMNHANFRAEDITIQHCTSCGTELEFWKDDVYLKCSNCGAENSNKGLGNTCLSWCKKASDCIGNKDIEQWLKKSKLK